MNNLFFIKKEIINWVLFLVILSISTFKVYSQNSQKIIIELLDNRYEDFNLNLKRIDSAIIIAKQLNDNKLLGDIYFQKAAYIYSKREYNEALEYYIKANNISKINNDYIYYSSLYGIAIIKQQLGEYDESIKMLDECLNYFSKNNTPQNYKAYTSTLGRLSYLYTKINNISKSQELSKLEFINSQTKLDSAYAFKNLGIIEFYKNNYTKSIKNLDKSELLILKNDDISWYMTIQHFKGENYLKLNDKEKAYNYFNKVISLFNKYKIVNNDIRKSFEILINYYNKIEDKENELKTINNLLLYDSVFFDTNRVLSKSYFKKYENSQLIEERDLLIEEKESSKIFFTILFIIVIILILIILYYYRRYRKENKNLLNYINSINNAISIESNIKADVEADPKIEEKLILFENGEMFNNSDFDLDDLSKILGYNRSIVSRYINSTRGKNFNQYINSLRIKHIVERLLHDEKLRNLTIDALAEECGFNSRKTFANSFVLYTGFRPSFFIKNLKM